MTSREKLLRKPIYWYDMAQNEIFRQVSEYMEKEGLNRTELAKKLNFSKGYVTQLMNGDFNYSLKKLIELGLQIGVVPQISYKPIAEVLSDDIKSQAKYSATYSYDNVMQLVKTIPNNEPETVIVTTPKTLNVNGSQYPTRIAC